MSSLISILIIIIILGKYPVKPTFPAVPGNECVAEVIGVGSSVTDFCLGDHIVPCKTAIGTWRTHSIYQSKDVMKVPKEMGIVEAATITVNPCTSYRMLKDFVDLKPGDTVIQNGANSACGQNIIQLCKAWGLNCVGIVRNRPEIDELVCYLKSLGATGILTEEELRKTTLFKSGTLPKPKLALNCVGGKNALEIVRHMENGSIMVTYGGMSREPVSVPTSALIFKDIRFHGFWMTRWKKDNPDEGGEMLSDLTQLILNKCLVAPVHELIPFCEYENALQNALNIQGFAGKKYVFEF